MLIMLAVSALIGGIAALYLNGLWGTITGLAVFIAWFQFNRYHSTTGLFKANLNSYFMFRRSGKSVEEALVSMVASRYGFPNERSLRVIKRIADLDAGTAERVSEEERVVTAVNILFQDEHGLHWDTYDDKRYEATHNQIKSLYRRIGNDQTLTTPPPTEPRYAGFWTRYFALCGRWDSACSSRNCSCLCDPYFVRLRNWSGNSERGRFRGFGLCGAGGFLGSLLPMYGRLILAGNSRKDGHGH